MAEQEKLRKAAGNRGQGRKPGIPNKSTTLAREAIAHLVESNAPKLMGWLEEIAEDPKHGPMAAYRCLMDVMEFHLPKLARTELTGKDGKDFTVNLGDKFKGVT